MRQTCSTKRTRILNSASKFLKGHDLLALKFLPNLRLASQRDLRWQLHTPNFPCVVHVEV